MGSAFSCLRGKKVGGIELNAGEISGYIHTTAGMRILNKRDFLQPSGFSTGDETVVIPRGETQLVPIRIDPIPDAPAGTKIHLGSGHRENPPSGETPGRNFQEAATVQCDPVVEDTTGIVPGEIKEAVIGEIDECFSVTDALIANVQTVGIIQRIDNADV